MCSEKRLQEPIVPLTFLKNGLRPSTHIESIVEGQYIEGGGIREEFAEDEAFEGQLRDCPLQSFRMV